MGLQISTGSLFLAAAARLGIGGCDKQGWGPREVRGGRWNAAAAGLNADGFAEM